MDQTVGVTWTPKSVPPTSRLWTPLLVRDSILPLVSSLDGSHAIFNISSSWDLPTSDLTIATFLLNLKPPIADLLKRITKSNPLQLLKLLAQRNEE